MMALPTFLLTLFLLVFQLTPCQGSDKHAELMSDFRRHVRICSGTSLDSELLAKKVTPFTFFERKIQARIENDSGINGVHMRRIFGFGGPTAGFLEIEFTEEGKGIFEEFSQRNSGNIGLLVYKGAVVGAFEISNPVKVNINACIHLEGEFKKFLPLLFSPELLAPLLYPVYNSG